jgi:hypothetical protein
VKDRAEHLSKSFENGLAHELLAEWLKFNKHGFQEMKKRFKRIQIFLVIAISLFILALPAYLRCTELSQTKFVSSDLSFENPDQEERVPDNEKELKGFGLSTVLIMFLLGTNLLEESSHLSHRSLSFCQKTSVLRC